VPDHQSPRPVCLARRTALAVLLGLVAAAPLAYAQGSTAYPVKPVRFIVPYPAGGGNDDVARILSVKLGEGLGQPVVVENKPGAGGMIAGEYVAKSAPDGYTIMIDHSAIVMHPSLYPSVSYDVKRDLAPVTLAVTLGNNFLVHPAVPAQNIKELIALAKAQPGKLNYSSPGNGSPQHIGMEVFKRMAGVDIMHVPYKGGAPATMAVIAGDVQMILSGTTGLPHVKSGKLRAIATTGEKRSALLPDVPTVAEALPGYTSVTWLGIFVPAKTPAPVIARLHAELVKVLNDEGVRKQLVERNFESVGSTTEAFAKAIDEDMAFYGKVIREAGIKAD